ncbi:MAG: DnaJ domain-containing protein [Marmoricola sp.]|nr:DnaJ domain-containing protein [Marmoricola sp.]
MDPYALLGIAPGADEHEVRRAYRQVVRELHPDLQPEHLRVQSGRRLQAVNDARAQVLEEIRSRRELIQDREPEAVVHIPRQRRPPDPTLAFGGADRWAARQAWLREQQRHIDDWSAARPAREEQRRESVRRHVRRAPVGVHVWGLVMLLVLVTLQVGVVVGVVHGVGSVVAAGGRPHGIGDTSEDLDLRQVLALLDSWRS